MQYIHLLQVVIVYDTEDKYVAMILQTENEHEFFIMVNRYFHKWR